MELCVLERIWLKIKLLVSGVGDLKFIGYQFLVNVKDDIRLNAAVDGCFIKQKVCHRIRIYEKKY